MIKKHKIQQIKMQKVNSFQNPSSNQAPLKSPNMTSQDQAQTNINLLMSAHSKNSNNNLGVSGQGFNNFTIRSQKSHNSGGTHGQYTNRGDRLSIQQKSPNMSEVTDPYAYFNMQQQQAPTVAPSTHGGHTLKVSIAGIKQINSLQSSNQQMSASNRSNSNSANGKKEQIQHGGVKSCRPTLYNKQQLIISQRGKLDPQQLAISNLNSQPTNQEQILAQIQQKQEGSLRQDGEQLHQSPGGIGGTSYVQMYHQNQSNVNRKIFSGAVGNRTNPSNGANSAIYYENYPQIMTDKIAAKTSGKGSHGSNFNLSSSTYPAAPVQKLSDVQNPQKYMTFRFANRQATRIQEIQLFKNLQELDISGNQLQEQVKELTYLNFLKRLNLSNNKIYEPWVMPQSIEILNISQNFIKIMPEEVCRKLKNVSTIDISQNKLESLENFHNMRRLKRLLAKNNFVRELSHIEGIQNIFELDLEGNAIDSHKDFLKFIKDKNDLIVVNLAQNPLLVDVMNIEKLNEDLIQRAPELITQKSQEEIDELKQLLGVTTSGIQVSQQQSMQVNGESSQKCGEETSRLLGFNLIEELQSCLTFLKNGILYRNKRVFTKIKQIQSRVKRGTSNYSNSSAQNNSGPKNSVMFSPMISKKSRRYEDVEAQYDQIVEQEELRRLKQNKIIAKRRKQRKKQMISRLENDDSKMEGDHTQDSPESNSSDFSDDEIDDDDFTNDLENSQVLNMLNGEDRDDLDDDSCMIDQDSSNLLQFTNFNNYPNQHLHDDEEISQTITSDLEADLHSYKRCDENGDQDHYGKPKFSDRQSGDSKDKIDLDDRDYLNGSTAGFGKKLREINREINQEQQDQLDKNSTINSQKLQASSSTKKQLKQYQSAKKEKIDNIDIDNNVEMVKKTKQKFDLNLSKLTKNQSVKFENFNRDSKVLGKEQNGQSSQDMPAPKVNYNKHSKKKQRMGADSIINEFVHKKQIKTVQNSNESSQHSESTKNILLKSKIYPNHKMGITTIANSNDERTTSNKPDTNHQELNQSFSLRNIQQNVELNHEVESLMITTKKADYHPDMVFYNEQAVNHNPGSNNVCILIDPKQSQQSLKAPTEGGGMGAAKGEGKGLNESQSQQVITAELLNVPGEAVNQSMNQSSLNESIAQSGVSMTQNSKKGKPLNFKLDLSKCKNDDGDFEPDPGFIVKIQDNDLADLDHLMLTNGNSNFQTNEDFIEYNNSSIDKQTDMGHIILDDCESTKIGAVQINISNDLKPIKIKKSPKINLSSKKMNARNQTDGSERGDLKNFSPDALGKLKNSKEFNISEIENDTDGQQSKVRGDGKTGNVTVRDPTPALTKSRSRTDTDQVTANTEDQEKRKQLIAQWQKGTGSQNNLSVSNDQKKQIKIKKCPLCLDLKSKLTKLEQSQQLELQDAYAHIEQLRAVINNFKDMFEITGEIDFGFTFTGESQQTQDKNVMSLEDYVDLTGKMFNQIMQDFKQSSEANSKLVNSQKAQQKRIQQLQLDQAEMEAFKSSQEMAIKLDKNSLSAQKDMQNVNYHHSTKRSQNQVQIPLINHLDNHYNGKIPPKTTTSRQGKKKASYGGNSGVSIMSNLNDTPESQNFQQKFSIQNQYVQFSKDASLLSGHIQNISLTPEDSSQQMIVFKQSSKNNQRQYENQNEFVQKPKINGKAGVSLQIKTSKLQKNQIKFQDQDSSDRYDNSSTNVNMINEIDSAIMKSNQTNPQDKICSPRGPVQMKDKQQSQTVRNPSSQQKSTMSFKVQNKVSQRYEHQYEANTFSNCSVQYPQHSQQNQFNESTTSNQLNQFDDLNMLLENTKMSMENSMNTHNSNSIQNSVQTSQCQLKNKKVKVQGQSTGKQSNQQIKSKSQRSYTNNKLVPQNFQMSKQRQEDNSIYITNNLNLQLIQQQILRNQSNTSRGPNCQNQPIYQINNMAELNSLINQQNSNKSQSSDINKSQNEHMISPDNINILENTQEHQQVPIVKNSKNPKQSIANKNLVMTQKQKLQYFQQTYQQEQQILQGNPVAISLNQTQFDKNYATKQLSNSMKQSTTKQSGRGQMNVPINLKKVSKLNHLQKSLEQIKSSSQQNNYKTSRIPMSNSKSFIEENYNEISQNNYVDQNQTQIEPSGGQMFNNFLSGQQIMEHPEASEQYNSNQNNNQIKIVSNQNIQLNELGQFQPTYHTQRRITNNLHIKNAAGKLVSIGEIKTQRNQRQSILNKSGGEGKLKMNEKPTTLVHTKQTCSLRGQSVNMVIDNSESQNHIASYGTKITSVQASGKRPQSVVDTGGRKFQKIQNPNLMSSKNRKGSQNRDTKSGSKHNKSADRKSSKQPRSYQNAVMSQKGMNQIKQQQLQPVTVINMSNLK